MTGREAARRGWVRDGGWWLLDADGCTCEVYENGSGSWSWHFETRGGWQEWGLADTFGEAVRICEAGVGGSGWLR